MKRTAQNRRTKKKKGVIEMSSVAKQTQIRFAQPALDAIESYQKYMLEHEGADVSLNEAVNRLVIQGGKRVKDEAAKKLAEAS